MRIVVMGVAGSGKSTLGAALAGALGLPFTEGDALHSPEAVARMARGVPLSDADRWPWLDRVAAALARPGVASCSALRRAYRDRLRAQVPGLVFVHPQAPEAAVAARLAGREGHFLPPSLLPSQYATLEPTGAEPDVIALDALMPTAAQVAHVRAALAPN